MRASFMILAGDAKDQLAAIDKMEGSDEDRRPARARLLAQLLAGTVTMLSVKGSLPGIRGGQHLFLDTPERSADRAPDAQRRRAVEGGNRPVELAGNGHGGAQAHRPVQGHAGPAAGDQALSVGPVSRNVLEGLLARLKLAQGAELQMLTELTSRSRLGAYVGEAVAGNVTAATANHLNALDAESC